MTRRLPKCEHEHNIEQALLLALSQAGHLCLKFISPGFPGVPDRIVLLDDGRVLFVECKAPGQPLRRAQPVVVNLMRDMGHRVEIIDTEAKVRHLLHELGV